MDIEADRRRADVAGAAVGRLHEPGTAARRDDVVALTSMGASAPPRSDTMRPKRRASSYQRAMLAAAGAPRASPFASRMRALPRTTMVVRTPHERSRSSALANSSR